MGSASGWAVRSGGAPRKGMFIRDREPESRRWADTLRCYYLGNLVGKGLIIKVLIGKKLGVELK